MDILDLIILWLIIIIIVDAVIYKKQEKLLKKLISYTGSLVELNKDLMFMKMNLLTILKFSKETKENYFVTLEKIEKELLNNNPFNSENTDKPV